MDSLSLEEKFYVYITAPFASFTSLVLVLSAIVLNHITDAVLFSYLKLEILFALIYSFIIVVGIIVKCSNCFPLIDRLAVCAYRYYVFNYLLLVVETASILMGILASLACLGILDSSKNSKLAARFLKLNPNLAALVAFALSALLFGFELSVSHYHPMSANSTSYECLWIADFVAPPRSIFIITSFLISYGLLVVVLIVINALIVARVRQNLRNSKSVVIKDIAAKRRSFEQKLTKLIVTDCFNLIMGRFPCFILILVFIVIGPIRGASFPFSSLSDFIFLFSLNVKFLILYQLNVKFKNGTLRVLVWIFCCRRNSN